MEIQQEPLATHPPERAIPLTLETAFANLTSSDLSLRYYAAWWLGKFAPPSDRVFDGLIAALNDNDDRTALGGYPLRRNAARALGEFGDKRAVDALVNAGMDRSSPVSCQLAIEEGNGLRPVSVPGHHAGLHFNRRTQTERQKSFLIELSFFQFNQCEFTRLLCEGIGAVQLLCRERTATQPRMCGDPFRSHAINRPILVEHGFGHGYVAAGRRCFHIGKKLCGGGRRCRQRKKK